MSEEKESKSESGVDQEKSTARTEAPASNRIRDAIYIVEKLGVSGARDYVERMPLTARWDAVRQIIYALNPRQTQKANLAHLRRSILESTQ